MSKEILILGGYGNFGKRIAEALVAKGIGVIIAGRNRAKAESLAQQLGEKASTATFDIQVSLAEQLERLKPAAVVHTCGPFQGSDYRVAEICIEKGVACIDLADAREFVAGIGALDAKAKEKGVAVISGASTVPGLSSAVIEHYTHEFSEIDFMRFGIAPGQQAERGPATTKGVMSYVGRKLKPFPGIYADIYGWQDIYRQNYPELGKRWMANCDIPDLDLLPEKYGIKQIQFSAGLELSVLHIGLWLASWAVRLGVPLDLPALSDELLKVSNLFDRFGSPDGGMHIILQGQGQDGKSHERRWFLIAKDGSGPHIPTIPAIVLASRLAQGANLPSGAYPCLGLVSLEEYLVELSPYPIHTVTEQN